MQPAVTAAITCSSRAALLATASRWAEAQPVDKSRCLVVEAVAEESVAWLAGVRAGDLLVTINSTSALAIGKSRVEMADVRNNEGVAIWEFAKQEVVKAELVALRFQTTSPCIGIEVGLSVEAAAHLLAGAFTMGPCAKFTQALPVYWRVWEAGEFHLLRNKTPRWGMHPTSPLTLFNAAARLELGDAGSIRGIRRFAEVEERWTIDFHSLVRLYTAKALQGENPHHDAVVLAAALLGDPDEIDAEEAIAALAAESWSLNRQSLRVKQFAALYVDPSELMPKATPAVELGDYDLPVLKASADLEQQSQTMSLASAMDRGAVLLIILLGTYRANGPYDVLMHQWVKWSEAFKEEGLHECHVITCNADERTAARRPAWFVGENAALGKTPIALLHDTDGQVYTAIQGALGEEIEGSPFGLLVHGRQVIESTLGDRDLTDVSVFNALRRAKTPTSAAPEQ